MLIKHIDQVVFNDSSLENKKKSSLSGLDYNQSEFNTVQVPDHYWQGSRFVKYVEHKKTNKKNATNPKID